MIRAYDTALISVGKLGTLRFAGLFLNIFDDWHIYKALRAM